MKKCAVCGQESENWAHLKCLLIMQGVVKKDLQVGHIDWLDPTRSM